MAMRLIESLETTEALSDLFSDQSVLQAMLDFEVALAKAEARCRIIPQSAADAITTSAKSKQIDSGRIARDSQHDGTVAIPFVKALTEIVRSANPEAAGFVHWGATSQDLCDTALILLLTKAQPLLEADLIRLKTSLRDLSEKHRDTIMLGRTLMQAAPPITFGLKAAGWFGAIERTEKHLASAFNDVMVLQFGGASGTLASLGDRGIEIGNALAEELGLQFPEAPWHAHRDRLALLMTACGILTATLAKMARDISLLMQNEIGEVSEASGEGRGGSSTMPHKQNPVGCAITLAAAQRVPSLVSSFLSGMIQEHERGVGGWQAEWSTVARTIQATGVALASMAEVAEGLTVNEAKMRANIEATRGTIFAEKVMMLLGPKIGRDVAHRLLESAVKKSGEEGVHLVDVLREMPEVTRHLDSKILDEIEIPEKYLGMAEDFRKRLLSAKYSGQIKEQ